MLALLLQGCPRVSPPGDSEELDSAQVELPGGSGPLLMISIDTLRVRELGAYGGSAETAHLDDLVARGTHFSDLRSCSNWTYPAAACALLGEDLVELGFMPGRAHGEGVERLPDDALRLAEHLQAAGYRTALVSGNSILGNGLGFGRGYGQVAVIENGHAETLVDEGLTLLDELTAGAGHWALHVHFMDPHLNYDPPEAYRKEIDEEGLRWELSTKPGIVALVEEREAGEVSDYKWEDALAAIHAFYEAELEYLDDQVGRLLAELEARGHDDLVVVVWSDHGESLGEHDAWFHHGTLHDVETRALGTVVTPGGTPQEVAVPLDLTAVLPATLAALELAAPPTWEEGPRYADVAQEEGFQTSVDLDGQRLVYQSWTGALQRYDLTADPDELDDLAAPDDVTTQELWALLEARASQLAEILPTAPVIAPDLAESRGGSAR